jgi:DNA transposition AAA+ family ATPase
MKEVFVSTPNYQRFEALVNELTENRFGVEMAAVVGQAGRGKTTAAERIGTQSDNAVYVRHQERFSPVGLLREVAFCFAGTRHRNTDTCFELIEAETRQRKAILMVDEADRLSLRHLNMLRDLHDTCSMPVVLIGEEKLHNKLGQERRIRSRIRDEIKFEPVSQSDLAFYYRKALGIQVEAAHGAELAKHSEGDFRFMVRDAWQAEYLMKVNGLGKLTDDLVKTICNGKGGK